MEHEFIIEALTQENNILRSKLAVNNMEATSEDKEMAEKLFQEQQNEIAVLVVELSAMRRSRDEFQEESRRLKYRIAALEKKLKG